MIRTIATGNIGKSAVIKEINGRKLISFSVAVNESYKNTDGIWVDKTTWIDCSIWRDGNGSTEAAKHLTAGVKVFVSGKPSTEIWRDKDGKPNVSYKLNVDEFERLTPFDKKEENGNNSAPQQSNGNNQQYAESPKQFDTPENMGVEVPPSGTNPDLSGIKVEDFKD